jgi:VWFA-related protein
MDPSYWPAAEVRSGQVEKIYHTANATLSVLAEESGGQIYYVKKIDDLDGVYESVLNDLSTIYSVGYTPSNEIKDGAWRSLKVELRGHPGLKAHTRRGYYTKK